MKEKLRLGYFADGRWAHEAFKLLIEDASIDINFICVRYDTNDYTLKSFCKKYNISFLRHKNINDMRFQALLKKYNCDLFVSMSFNQIFKKSTFEIPKLKTINCHAGKLPFYRGRNILNWALINDEKEYGITVHYIDEGIDTGDIILQKTYKITDNDDYSTLLERSYIYCADILYQAIKKIQNGRIHIIKQSELHPVGFYCGQRIEGDEIIDWNNSSRTIFNFIRAICKPGPMAQTTNHGKKIFINKARINKNSPVYKCIPGMIVGKTKNTLIIKTKDSIIELLEFFYEGKSIKIGDRLL
jgi:methionyl-tRNA formyltransferase